MDPTPRRPSTSRHGNPAGSILVLFLAGLLIPSTTRAQSELFVGLAVEHSSLKAPTAGTFPAPSAVHPSLSVGLTVLDRHRFGISVTGFEAETSDPTLLPDQIPVTVGVDAVPVSLWFEYGLPSPLARVVPLLTVEMSWVPVDDSQGSDTPRETGHADLLGWTAGAGLRIELASRLEGVLEAGYRVTGDPEDRSVQTIGVTGSVLRAGLRIAF